MVNGYVNLPEKYVKFIENAFGNDERAAVIEGSHNELMNIASLNKPVVFKATINLGGNIAAGVFTGTFFLNGPNIFFNITPVSIPDASEMGTIYTILGCSSDDTCVLFTRLTLI